MIYEMHIRTAYNDINKEKMSTKKLNYILSIYCARVNLLYLKIFLSLFKIFKIFHLTVNVGLHKYVHIYFTYYDKFIILL